MKLIWYFSDKNIRGKIKSKIGCIDDIILGLVLVLILII